MQILDLKNKDLFFFYFFLKKKLRAFFCQAKKRKKKELQNLCFYLTIRGGSLKKIAKNIIPKVPTNKNV
jgi:hypothetical protein